MDYMLEAKNVSRGFPMPGGETYMALKGVDLYAPTGKLTILKWKSLRKIGISSFARNHL